jgi:endonuclease YncB( thermonuclease family)
MDQLPFASLAVALAVFLLSTRQFALRWRALIWLAGTALTGLAIWMALAAPNPTSFLETAVRYPGALLQALSGNWESISAALPPMFDILVVATGLVAIACLVAFTPGEAVERITRPFNIALLGAVGGALIALAIAGVGFGGAVKRKVYIGTVAAADVHDGDTLIMGDVSLRLWGIDAPERKQPCAPPHEAEACGAIALGYLANLVEGQLLVCTKPNGADGTLRETFGRPLVECTRQLDGLNIGKAMISAGCADPFRDNGKTKSNYQNDAPSAGAIRLCPPFTPPEDWRERR